MTEMRLRIGLGLRFATRQVGNSVSVRQVELTKVAEIGCGETLAITIGQLLSQAFDQGLAIGRSLVALLKRFDHLAADVPIR